MERGVRKEVGMEVQIKGGGGVQGGCGKHGGVQKSMEGGGGAVAYSLLPTGMWAADSVGAAFHNVLLGALTCN